MTDYNDIKNLFTRSEKEELLINEFEDGCRETYFSEKHEFSITYVAAEESWFRHDFSNSTFTIDSPRDFVECFTNAELEDMFEHHGGWEFTQQVEDFEEARDEAEEVA